MAEMCKSPSNRFLSSIQANWHARGQWPPSQLYRPILLHSPPPSILHPFIWTEQWVGDRAATDLVPSREIKGSRQGDRVMTGSHPTVFPSCQGSLLITDLCCGMEGCMLAATSVGIIALCLRVKRKGRFSSQQSSYLLWDLTPLWSFDVFPMTWIARSDVHLNSSEVTEAQNEAFLFIRHTLSVFSSLFLKRHKEVSVGIRWNIKEGRDFVSLHLFIKKSLTRPQHGDIFHSR